VWTEHRLQEPVAERGAVVRRDDGETSAMAKVISESALKLAVEEGTFIKGGTPACAEGLKYDFRLGKRILKASIRPAC
jgi:hypothetical protein